MIFFYSGSHNYLCGKSADPGDLMVVRVPEYHNLLFDSTLIHRGGHNTSEENAVIRPFGKFTCRDALCERRSGSTCVSAQQISIYG